KARSHKRAQPEKAKAVRSRGSLEQPRPFPLTKEQEERRVPVAGVPSPTERIEGHDPSPLYHAHRMRGWRKALFALFSGAARALDLAGRARSEERRVGKECRWRRQSCQV